MMDDSKYQIDLLTALNERLMNSEKMYRHISECTGSLFMYFDFKMSPAKVSILGPWDDIFGERIANHPYEESYILNLFCEEDQDIFRTKILNAERNNVQKESIEIRSKNRRNWFTADAYIFYDGYENPTEKIVLIKDITKDKYNSEELEYLAYYDSLTGVYNRNYFVRNLRDLCEKAEGEKVSVEVIFLDIDNFKKINDSVGLLLGDELVQAFGQFLKEFNNDNITVGRYGSDVFCISVYNPCGSRSANDIYRKVIERLRKPFVLSNKSEIKITVTAGVAEYPDAGKTALEVIKNTDIILYDAKENGSNKIRYFEPEILDRFNKKVYLEKKLEEGITNEDFQVYFQPMFYNETGKLRGCEVLARWPGDDSHFVSEPAEFIGLAEKSGFMYELGELILRDSIRAMNDWRMKYHLPITLCINISIAQLNKDNFIEDLMHAIQLFGINPEQIELELTEKCFMEDYDSILDKLKTLKAMGIKISLDNFGVGYSSVTSLRKLPIDTLKFDKSLLENALSDDSSATVLEFLINLANKLGIETVAEGVETKELFSFMRKTKCNVLQGFLLGKPVAKSEFEKVLIRQLP